MPGGYEMPKICLHAIILLIFSSAPASSCGLKLLLSWDVSASMSAEEFEIQRSGTAQAFRDPNVMNAISLMRGGVAVALMQWAGPGEQVVSVKWTFLHTGNDALAFSRKIEDVQLAFATRTGTAIGNGLRKANAYLADGPSHCMRSVVDISGDGKSNAGIDTTSEAEALAQTSVTINGLVLPGRMHHKMQDEDTYMYYVRHVARGPSSFVMDVYSYADFPRAMKRKLLRELSQKVAANTANQ